MRNKSLKMFKGKELGKNVREYVFMTLNGKILRCENKYQKRWEKR